MAKSKNLHVVTASWTVEINQDDPSTNLIDEQVDLSLLLSQNLGRQIRQGNSFRVVGWQAGLKPTSSGDFDLGGAVAVRAQYIPTNRHVVKAWNQVHAQWMKQKKLAFKAGNQVRYDDMEFAWSDGFITSRTSSVYGSGVGDTSTESLCVYGSSTSGTDFVLYDYYNSANPPYAPSRDHFTNNTVKDAKFSTTFPPFEYLMTTATASSGAWSHEDLVSIDGYSSGVAMDDLKLFPSDNHVSMAMGLVRLQAQGFPPDTAWQNADSVYLSVSFFIEGWSPLKYRAKNRPLKRSYGYKPKRRYYPRQRTMKGRRRYYRR